jgi:hypothetical protein
MQDDAQRLHALGDLSSFIPAESANGFLTSPLGSTVQTLKHLEQEDTSDNTGSAYAFKVSAAPGSRLLMPTSSRRSTARSPSRKRSADAQDVLGNVFN